MIIQDCTSSELGDLLEQTSNSQLKNTSTSRIKIFSYYTFRNEPERQHTILRDENHTIHGISSYRPTDTTFLELIGIDQPEYRLCLIGISKDLQGRGHGTQLLDHTLSKIAQQVSKINLAFVPDDKIFTNRWEEFLRKKAMEHGLTLRESMFG